MAGDIGIQRPGAGRDHIAIMCDVAHMGRRADHHTGDTAIADKKVGSGAERQQRNVCGAGGKEVAKIVMVSRAEDYFGGSADAEPGMLGHWYGAGILAAHRRQAVDEAGRHAPFSRSLSISSGSCAAQPVMSPAPRHITRSPLFVRARISCASASGPASAAGPR